MSTNTIEKVRNYQGTNTFVIKMKGVISQYGGLTPRQAEAVEKCLNSVIEVNGEELTEDLKKISEYKGENTFVKDIASKLVTYGSLSQKQMEAALKQIEKEESEFKSYRVNWETTGQTIKLGRKIGMKLKEEYNLKFNPILVDITKVLEVSLKAVKFRGKLTVKRGDVCMCCAKTLTDEFSMLTHMGKLCASHMGVEYIKDKSEAERFREEYLKRVEEIGSMDFWVPKTQIKKWGSVTEKMVDSMF